MYTEPLNASQIAHNFRILKQRYQLLDPSCAQCTFEIPSNDLTYSIFECPTPTPTETPTLTPTNTQTPTETPTNTPTNTETPTQTPTLTPTNTASETPTNTDRKSTRLNSSHT